MAHNIAPHQVIAVSINFNYFSISSGRLFIVQCMKRARASPPCAHLHFWQENKNPLQSWNINDGNRCFVKKMSFFDPFDVWAPEWTFASGHLSLDGSAKSLPSGSYKWFWLQSLAAHWIYQWSAMLYGLWYSDDDNHFSKASQYFD